MVWKGSVRTCLEHGGSTFFALKNVAKFSPPWTVTHSVWLAALRPDVSGVVVDALLFHEAGRRLVHRYRVCKDPFPHPALRDGVIPRLLSCVSRAMAIAQLTYLRISIPALGDPRWRLAQEGPFLAEWLPEYIRSLGAGCAFRNTTYRDANHASPSGDYGLPMHHPL